MILFVHFLLRSISENGNYSLAVFIKTHATAVQYNHGTLAQMIGPELESGSEECITGPQVAVSSANVKVFAMVWCLDFTCS